MVSYKHGLRNYLLMDVNTVQKNQQITAHGRYETLFCVMP